MAAIASYSSTRTKTFSTLALSALMLVGVTLLMPSARMAIQGTAALLHTPDLSRLPLSFEPNAGQTDPSVRFTAHAMGGALFFTPSEVVLTLAASEASKDEAKSGANPGSAHAELTTQSKDRAASRSSTLRLQFIGSNPSATVEQGSPLPGKVSYFIGKDPAQWHTDLPTYAGVTYSNLYPGVSLAYSGEDGHLKGTYTLAPGVSPSLIQWRYAGAENTVIDLAGNLQITLDSAILSPQSAIQVTEKAPVAWQTVNGEKITVSSRYAINADGSIGFALGEYDHTRPLTIDPTITYSTYLGGFYGDAAFSVALDSARNMYVTGLTSSSDFPMAGNSYQPQYGGGQYDLFASKISADGATLIYSTFLGGNDWDYGQFVSVDAEGQVILGGYTTSVNFPTTPGVVQTECGGNSSVTVTKLNATGSGLIYSTCWGGGTFEPGGYAVDGAGNVYLTGYFYIGSNRTAFVDALNSNATQVLFENDLGGVIPGPGDENANTEGAGIAVDATGNVYVTGYTRAADFPTTPGAYRTTIQRYEDGFITKYNPMGQSILYSTYIPGNVSEYPKEIAVDSAGNAYIAGYTLSHDYPTTVGAFQTICGDPTCAMVTKLNPAGSALVYSTYLGGPNYNGNISDIAWTIHLNSAGNAYVSGSTSSAEFPVVNPIQATLNGAYDAFLTKFNLDGTGVEYSTYLGGSNGENANGITLDNAGNLYLVGGTGSTDFPLVNPLQATNHGRGDAFIMRIAEGATTPTPMHTGTPPTGTPTQCVPGVTTWRTEPPFSAGRDYATGAVADNKLYVIGGWAYVPSPTFVAQVERFDPVSMTWATVAPIPNVGRSMAAVGIGAKLYVAGGWGQSFEMTSMQIYDSLTNTWSQGAPMPVRLSGPAVAAYNGKVYIFGGSRGYPDYGSNLVFEYDPATNTYASKAPMPSAQDEIGAAAIGNRIYVVGGYQYIHYVYDPTTDTWDTIASPPISSGFSNPGVFAFNDELWVVGGYDNYTRRGYPPNQEVQIYNPTTNSWHYGPAFDAPRSRSRAVGVIDGRAYVAGGADLNDDRALLTSLESITYLPCGTATPTATPANGPALMAHVNWEARPSPPNQLQVLPITLTLKLGATEVNYPTQLTDQYGFFTVTLGSLPNGAYSWRADDSTSALHSPNYMANSGVVNISGAPVTNVEMGLMRAGDANNDNRISLPDFNMLKLSFGFGCGNPQYDNRADFTGDCQVNIADFNPLKTNYGHNGGPPIGPDPH